MVTFIIALKKFHFNILKESVNTRKNRYFKETNLRYLEHLLETYMV